MRLTLLLLLLLLLSVPCYADSGIATGDAFSGEDAASQVAGSSALAVIEGLFTERLNGLVQNNFGGFQDVLNAAGGIDGEGYDTPVVEIGQTDMFGDLSIDFSVFPEDFWSIINLVSLFGSSWMGFIILVRP